MAVRCKQCKTSLSDSQTGDMCNHLQIKDIENLDIAATFTNALGNLTGNSKGEHILSRHHYPCPSCGHTQWEECD